ALILAFLDKGLMTVTVSALISVYLFQLLVP
ncbi:MAG TPA: branched-chain amino acid transporter, partial [Firmicutes bacterium]|nr:branched-chain amino acid transporter [Bacillota bacterium]